MTCTERILTALADRNCDPKRNGEGWKALCPAHDDHNPSLSISEGDDGRALVNCYAGCSAGAICGALGLRLADLMPDNGADVDKTRKRPRKTRDTSTPKADKTFPTANAAVAALEKKHGKRSARWTYHDADGNPAGGIVRWDTPTGKEIRPVALRGDAWIIGGMPAPRPLYGLPELAGADRVYVCEGEKAADAARSIGLTATTSAHGSLSPDKADWACLAGKEVVILPDHDDPGEMYADAVAAILAKLTPTPVVKVVELPELPEHGDIADWVEARDAHDPEELRATIEALADEAEAIQPDRPRERIERFRPFPTDALPEPLRGFVKACAKSIGCEPTMVALPLLGGLASAIGATRRILLKDDWAEPAVLWTGVVAESGSHKSPAQSLALGPLRRLQAWRLEEYPELVQAYERDLLLFSADLRAWTNKGRKEGEPPPDKPEEPSVARYLVNDITIEALADQLRQNPRGVLCDCDELGGWLGSFDQYRRGKGSDVARWLAMHRAEALVVDRKTGAVKTVFIKHAAVSVTGGIQPATLRRALGSEHFENGLAARLLLAAPPRRKKRWTDASVDPELVVRIERLFARLLALDFGTDPNDCAAPVDVPMTAEGKRVWVKFYNDHAKTQVEASGEYASVLSKIEAAAPRLALIAHLVRCAADDPSLVNADAVDEVSMRAGIEIARWFAYEARRVYAILNETDEHQGRRLLVELIQRKGGSVTSRDLMRSSRQFGSAPEAEAALDDLAKARYGRWVNRPASNKGGRPTRVFVLHDLADVDTNPTTPGENGSSVNVGQVNNPDGEWGQV